MIVIGAGSVGLPSALFLAERGLRVLVVERLASPGQGQNKAAIGGVRATHSDPSKILLGRQSIEVFSAWKEKYGEDIGWKRGGYCFPVYRPQDEKLLKGMLPVQTRFGLEIGWFGPDRIAELVPGIDREGLLGGTYSPGDGQVSPLQACRAFTAEAVRRGIEFRFNSPVTGIRVRRGRFEAVEAGGELHEAGMALIAAGASAAEVGALAGANLPVIPDSHEAGVTAPVGEFLGPLVVDLRPGREGRTANFYFGQNAHGAIIFCYTPASKFAGTDRRPTSEFMPVVAKRLVGLIPRLRHVLVRRVWRGLYPMTPDGIAIAGAVPGAAGLFAAVGMCGQGFMLGPGVGRNMAALMTDGRPLIDADAFGALRPERDFKSASEALK